MSSFDIGNLMCLPFDDIEPGQPTDAHEFLINAAASQLGPESRNWVPLIVKEAGHDQYEVIGNAFVYAVAAVAELEEVWCIIAEDTPETVAIAQSLSREVTPKVNLSHASREDIAAALDYVITQPASPLKGVNLATAVTRIDESPRKYWKTLKPISKLGCRITAGKKLKALEEIFYLTPEPMPEIVKDRSLLESFNLTQLKKMAKQRQLSGYSRLKKADLVDQLAA